MAIKICPAGHKMTKNNTYQKTRNKRVYTECVTCRKDRRTKVVQGLKRFHEGKKAVSQMEVITEDVTGITNCRKCEGILRWGEDSRLDDAVSCVYCGWRPSARTVSP
mgnify:FL=1